MRGIGNNHTILQHIHCLNHDSLGNGRAKIGLVLEFLQGNISKKEIKKKKYVVSKTETTNVTHCLT